MKKLTIDRFMEFYSAINKGREPFPWQKRVADKVGNEAKGWPIVIAVPTAAGKTTCIDIAVFALACGISNAPRRIFFVVDRRVVVDQAYHHALQLAKKLQEAETGILKEVADALCQLGGEDRPLDVYAVRGGMYREDTWIRSPLQPTIIASTVDQIGSRLLFRGYGVSPGMAPVHAGLVGNDALILIDEAHCSQPFCETLKGVERYRKWNDHPQPFGFVTMTATPGKDVPEEDIERDNEEDRNHPVLGKRISSEKPTLLIEAPKESAKSRVKLVDELAKQARQLMQEGFTAVGCIVNRVATARELAAKLQTPPDKKTTAESLPEVILLTGRMRPLDRDNRLKQLEPLFSGSSAETKPLFVVATQCLEVGADLDFHALVCECASLDALRQRFGRLNRIAARATAKAAVVIRADQTEDTAADPVYGSSLAETWKWLNSKATKIGDNTIFNFGVAAVREAIGEVDVSNLLAPTDSAPVMLPAHVDCWVQTAPIPTPDPDVALFLHGLKKPGIPDVQVVFRSDLGDIDANWKDIVALMPPSSSEVLPVRIDVFKRWLADESTTDESADVEGGEVAEEAELESAGRKALCWLGLRDKATQIVSDPNDVRPNRTYVVPLTAHGIQDLGDFVGEPQDHAEQAFLRSRDRIALRFIDTGLNPDSDDFEELLLPEIRKRIPENADEKIRNGFIEIEKRRGRRILRYPGEMKGFIVVGRNRLHQFDPTFDDDTSTESNTQREVSLDDHTKGVICHAHRLVKPLLPSSMDQFHLAARWHDIGKADPRFQAMLQGRSPRSLRPPLLAKSASTPITDEERELARTVHGFPTGGRHELLSLAVAENLTDDDLILHLIATHHGQCRPFAPSMEGGQPAPPSERQILLGESFEVNPAWLNPGERNATVPDRFWRIVRQHGWWGSAYMEAIFRLADQAASRKEQERGYQAPSIAEIEVPTSRSKAKPAKRYELPLPGLDGSNPLGFLAALGTLQFLNEQAKVEKRPDWLSLPPLLFWTVSGVGQTAVLSLATETSPEAFLDFLIERLPRKLDEHPMAFAIQLIETKNTKDAKQYLELAAQSNDSNRCAADWLSALMSEVNPDATGQLLVVRRDYLPDNLRSVLKLPEKAHFQRTLFQVWDYADGLDNQSLHWEPSEDRRHAYQWHQPSGDPTRKKRGGMLGANRLAIEAWPLFMSVPKEDKLSTRGFSGVRANDTQWTWPLWSKPLAIDSVISMISLNEIQKRDSILDRGVLEALSAMVAFRSRRILVGKTPNLTQTFAL